MSCLQSDDGPHIELILCADIHFSHTPPVARSLEPNWYATQKEYLDQLKALQFPLDRPVSKGPIPIVIAGDIFHKWNPPIELVNFVLENIPYCYAIPGQHDLPNHSYTDIKKSAYWTLVKSGAIRDLMPNNPVMVNNVKLVGFPWGTELQNFVLVKNSLVWDIAVVHKYVWSENAKYPGCPEEGNFKKVKKALSGYDIILTGDNHLPFTATNKEPLLVNPGGFMRRNIDQVDHKPRVYLLMSDKTIVPHFLDCGKDIFTDPDKALGNLEIAGNPIYKVIESLREMAPDTLSYEEAVKRFLDKNSVNPLVKKIILSMVDGWTS